MMKNRNVMRTMTVVMILLGLCQISIYHAVYVDYMSIEGVKPSSTTSMVLNMYYLNKGVYIFTEQFREMQDGDILLSKEAEVKKILSSYLGESEAVTAEALDEGFVEYVSKYPGDEKSAEKEKILACINKYELLYLEEAAKKWTAQDKKLIPPELKFQPAYGNLEVNVASKMIYMFQGTMLFIYSYKSAVIEGDESILTAKGYIWGYGQKTVKVTVVRNLDWMESIDWIQSLDTPAAVSHLGVDPSFCHTVLVAGKGLMAEEEPMIFSYIIGDAQARRKFKFIVNFVMDEIPIAFYIWKKKQTLIFVYNDSVGHKVSFIKLNDIVSTILEHQDTPDKREELKAKKLFHLSWSVSRNVFSSELVPVARVLLKKEGGPSAAPTLVSTASILKNIEYANHIDQRNGLLFNFGIYGRIQVVDVAMAEPTAVLMIRGAPSIPLDHVFMSPYQSAKDKTQFIVIIDNIVYSLTLSIRLIINEAGTGVSEHVHSNAANKMIEDFFTLEGRFERIADSRTSSDVPATDVPFTPSPPLAPSAWDNKDVYIYEPVKSLYYMDPWLIDTSLGLTSKKIMIGVGKRGRDSDESQIDHMQIIDLEHRYTSRSNRFEHPVQQYLYSSSDEVLFYYDLDKKLLHGIIYDSTMVDFEAASSKRSRDHLQHTQQRLEAQKLQEICRKRTEQREHQIQEKEEFTRSGKRRLQHISLFVYAVLFYIL